VEAIPAAEAGATECNRHEHRRKLAGYELLKLAAILQTHTAFNAPVSDAINAFYLATLMIRSFRKPNPRTEYRLRRTDQINSSPTLSEKFPKLKLLRVTVDFFDSSGVTRTGGMKYKVNLAHGRSLLSFNCVHPECIGGDYDLTEQLAQAIADKRKVVEGELRCQGTRYNKERKQEKPCQSILRYKLTLGY